MIEILSWKTFKQSNSVVILGAANSVIKNTEQIKKYITKNKSVVISANYPHPIPINYTTFIDPHIFRNMFNSGIISPNVILGKKIRRGRHFNLNKKKYAKILKKIIVINDADSPKTWNTKKIHISKKGCINHIVGNTGFASILLSIFFQPKEILLSGFDGPQNGLYHHCNSGIPSKKYIGRNNLFKQRQKYLKLILNYLKIKGICIKAFSNDSLWQINKAGITEIDIAV